MRDYRSSLLVIPWLIFSLSALNLAVAQQPSPPREPAKPAKKEPQRQGAVAEQPQDLSRETIRIETDLVQLDVTVIDQNGQPVFDLTEADFTVYEDKVQQKIESVSREEVPISLGLVIDTSGSMRMKLQTVSEAASSLIKQMQPKDEAFIAQFKVEPELVVDFTGDKRELEDALGELFTGGGTALLDAIIATSDYAQQRGKQRRKALVVITDGLEKNSSVKEKEVLEAIKENEVQLYLVGFIDEEETKKETKGLFDRSPAKKARELLNRLAEDSGGRSFFPQNVSEMPAIAAQIAKDLRTQYVISYYPSNEKRDGSFRKVQVVVNPRGNRKLIVRTRQGYYARKDKTTTQEVSNKTTLHN
jgi:Ca-activated chloride channel family protein